MAKKNKGRDGYIITEKNWRDPVEGVDDRGTKEAIKFRDVERGNTKIEGVEVTVNRVVTPLRALFLRGSINDEAFRLGLEFEDAFDMAHFEQIRAVDPMRPPSGSHTGSSVPVSVVEARGKVLDIIARVGGSGSSGATALWNIIGMRRSFREMEEAGLGDRKFWSGAFITVLSVLVFLENTKRR